VIYFLPGRNNMKKILLWIMVVSVALAFSSCTFPGTATLALMNSADSVHDITAVTFTPSDGGTADVRPHTIPPGERHCIYHVQPGLFDISATFEGHGEVTVENHKLIEEGNTLLRKVEAK
jgi:hypothetical protein